MASESGHNLRIARSRLGSPRFPFELSDVGDGYAGAGPVTTYFLPLEEIRKRYPTVAGKRPIQLPKRKEAENMLGNMLTPDTAGQEAPEVQENEGFKVFDNQKNPDTTEQEPETFYCGSKQRFTAERIARAEQALSREEYIRLKSEGVTDSRITKDYKLNFELLIALKKKWGLKYLRLKKVPPPRKKREVPGPVPQPEPTPDAAPTPPTTGLTIAQAVELRQELVEDINSLNRILDIVDSSAEQLTKRVVRMLEWQRDIHQAALGRLNEVFNRTVVQL